MSKFKVGDKVKFTRAMYSDIDLSKVGEVTRELDEGCMVTTDLSFAPHSENGKDFHLFFFDADLELVERENTTMTAIPFTTTGNSVSVFLNGKMRVVNSTDPGYRELYDHLNQNETHDVSLVEQLVDKKAAITRMSDGDVEIVGETVFYRNNEVHGSLSDKLVRMVGEGHNIKPWARFLENVMLNPSEASRQSLYNFLDHFKTPVTPDGHFLAFKRVGSDYKDLHSGKFDNSPGKIVEMRRDEVDDDSNRTCSRGLHACASSYLGSFYANDYNARVVVVKIHPRDVVAVPSDYQFSKMRVCRYEVLDDAQEDDIEMLSNSEYTDWGQPDPVFLGDDEMMGQYEDTPEALYPDARVRFAPHINMYYIVSTAGGMVYLHKDGTWHGFCGKNNFWESWEDAEEFLRNHNVKKTDPMDDYSKSFEDDYYAGYYDIYDGYYSSY